MTVQLQLPGIRARRRWPVGPAEPAKTTDARFADYARRFGHSSGELDALPPEYLTRLVHDFAVQFIDEDAWQASEQAIQETQARLHQAARAFERAPRP